MSAPLATIGILSIGEMGLGVAKLLIAHKFRIITTMEGRSQWTQKRAQTASIELVNTDTDFVTQSDYVLSIVPPRDALATAERVAKVASSEPFQARSKPLYYLDLNAVSPASARKISGIFAPISSKIKFIDGGIIGGPPKPKNSSAAASKWTCPSIPLSGQHPLTNSGPAGADLAQVLNTQHISDTIGAASGLKMCFASLTKGFTALATQSFTTAHRLGVLNDLQAHLTQYSPKTGEMTKSLTTMPPKAYRWVREMEEIGETFAADGGFEDAEKIFGGVAGTYALIADGTELGNEKTGERRRGTDVADVATCVSEGIEKRKIKTE